jgi:hypothetical protein
MAAMFILSVPMLVAAFGLSMDTARVSYVKDFLDNRANLAVSAAVATAYTSGTSTDRRVYLGRPSDGATAATALSNARDVYRINTAGFRSSTASGFLFPVTAANGFPNVKVLGAPLTNLQLCSPTSTARYGVTLTADETVRMTFLAVAGIKTSQVKVSSQAFVRATTC